MMTFSCSRAIHCSSRYFINPQFPEYDEWIKWETHPKRADIGAQTPACRHPRVAHKHPLAVRRHRLPRADIRSPRADIRARRADIGLRADIRAQISARGHPRSRAQTSARRYKRATTKSSHISPQPQKREAIMVKKLQPRGRIIINYMVDKDLERTWFWLVLTLHGNV